MEQQKYFNSAIKVKINGIEFKSLYQANKYYGKSKCYFSKVLKFQEFSKKHYKHWNIEILE